jgi:acetyl-CoA acetyltransferase
MQGTAPRSIGGNASQVTDGAAAVLLTHRKAEELGLKILAKHVTTSIAGLAPRIMCIGSSVAIPMVLKKAASRHHEGRRRPIFEVRPIVETKTGLLNSLR